MSERVTEAPTSRIGNGDYASPGLDVVILDEAFPHMIVGDRESNQWPYLRREINHTWYVDSRNPTVGFVSRDEALILYNSAKLFRGLPCLEIGCWRGWSTAHLALGAGNLEVFDPILADPQFYQDVSDSLRRAGVLDRVILHTGPSPDDVARISEATGKRWSFAFIDGDHEGSAPRRDAEVVHRYAAKDAMVMLHDLASPDVAAALVWLREHGWQTHIYQTMQIMAVAVRGSRKPINHIPDPAQNWVLPDHLISFPIIGEAADARLHRVMARIGGPTSSPREDQAASVIDSSTLGEAAAVNGSNPNGVIAADDELMTNFLGLQDRYLKLVKHLEEVQSVPSLQTEFDFLLQKHLELLRIRADLEASCDRLRSELNEARESAAANRRSNDEFENLSRKHVELLRKLGDTDIASLGNSQPDTIRRGPPEAAGELDALRQAQHLRSTIHNVAAWTGRRRTLFRLTRRMSFGRIAKSRVAIEQELRRLELPDHLVSPATRWISRPQTTFRLLYLRAFVGRDAMRSFIASKLERKLSIPSEADVAGQPTRVAPAGDSREVIRKLETQVAALQNLCAALEAAKLADENALLEADLVIAKLRSESSERVGRDVNFGDGH